MDTIILTTKRCKCRKSWLRKSIYEKDGETFYYTYCPECTLESEPKKTKDFQKAAGRFITV